MRYKEYFGVLDGTVKKLGILGEYHFYNQPESQFARTLLPEYELIVAEGWTAGPNDLNAYSPQSREVIEKIIRTEDRGHPTLLDIAREQKRQVICLEAGFPKPDLTMPTSITVDGKTYTYQEYNDILSAKKFCNTVDVDDKLSYQILRHLAQADRRDPLMAAGTIAYLRSHSDKVLLVCGEAHVPGIEARIVDQLELKEVKSRTL